MLKPHELTEDARILIAAACKFLAAQPDACVDVILGCDRLAELMLSDQVAISIVIANDAIKLG